MAKPIQYCKVKKTEINKIKYGELQQLCEYNEEYPKSVISG